MSDRTGRDGLVCWGLGDLLPKASTSLEGIVKNYWAVKGKLHTYSRNRVFADQAARNRSSRRRSSISSPPLISTGSNSATERMTWL